MNHTAPSVASSDAQQHPHRRRSPIAVSLISGAGAGLVNSIVCAPLDVAKTRMQVQGSVGTHKYRGVFSTIRLIYKEEGIYGCFRGLIPSVITVPLFWGMYFTVYNNIKTGLAEQYSNGHSKSWQHLCAAVAAGATGDLFSNPLWVVRTRMQTLHLHQGERALPEHTTMLQMFRHIYRNEGILAFYQGLSASFLGLAHVAVQFPLYEQLKFLARQRNHGNPESALDVLMASAVSKLVAMITTYPHEVIRARLQDQHRTPGQNMNLVGMFRHIIRSEGWTALYSGLDVNIIRVLPSTCTTFLSYELLSRYFQR